MRRSDRSGIVSVAEHRRTMKRTWLAAIIFVAISAGVFFRTYHLDYKVVWSDEVFSHLRAVGLTEANVVSESPQFRDVASLRAYVAGDARLRTGHVDATVRSLIEEDPQHPPLYFLLSRVWMAAFGDTILTDRLLSAFIGLLALPCAFWLARELFISRSVAWVYVALMAVSPVFVLYSQEDREYALWELTVLLTSAAVLRAIRTRRITAWILYGALASLALYTYPLSLAVIAAHAIYAGIVFRNDARALVVPLAAFAAAVISYAPWLMVISERRAQIAHDMSWIVSKRNEPIATLRSFFGEWHLAIFDFNAHEHSLGGFVIAIIGLIVIIAAFFILRRDAPRLSSAFVFCTLAASIAPVLLPDIFATGHRTANPRYLVPLFALIELALAYALARGIARDRRWNFGFAALVLAGFFSCATSSQSLTWWSKYNERSIDLARTMNRTQRPILMSDSYVHLVLSLAPYLKDGTRLAIDPRCYLCHAPDNTGAAARLASQLSRGDDIFLLGPSPALLRAVRERSASAPERVHCIDVSANCASDLELF